MVYCGRPSRGCQNCKDRRIKCDETKPRCRNCERTQRECPGFPKETDLIFRTEDPGSKHRVKKSQKVKKRWNVPPARAKAVAKAVNDLVEPVKTSKRKRRRKESSNLVKDEDSFDTCRRGSRYWNAPSHFEFEFQLDLSIEQQATDLFFKSFVPSQDGSDAARGYLEVASGMFDNAPAASPLRLATQAVAVSAMLKETGRDDLVDVAARLYGRALAATQIVMRHPKEATSDETLLSILLFALYEAIASPDHPTPARTQHIIGAVAIVKARGISQLENAQSRALFRAVKAQVLADTRRDNEYDQDSPSSEDWLSDLPENPAGVHGELEYLRALPDPAEHTKPLLEHEWSTEIEPELDWSFETQQMLRDWELYMPSN